MHRPKMIDTHSEPLKLPHLLDTGADAKSIMSSVEAGARGAAALPIRRGRGGPILKVTQNNMVYFIT